MFPFIISAMLGVTYMKNFMSYLNKATGLLNYTLIHKKDFYEEDSIIYMGTITHIDILPFVSF